MKFAEEIGTKRRRVYKKIVYEDISEIFNRETLERITELSRLNDNNRLNKQLSVNNTRFDPGFSFDVNNIQHKIRILQILERESRSVKDSHEKRQEFLSMVDKILSNYPFHIDLCYALARILYSREFYTKSLLLFAQLVNHFRTIIENNTKDSLVDSLYESCLKGCIESSAKLHL